MNIPRRAIIEHNGPSRSRYLYVLCGSSGYLISMTTGQRYEGYSEQKITGYIKQGLWIVIQDLDDNDLPNVDDLI